MNGEGENGSKEDMNSMNHSTLSSLLQSTYDPQHSTDPDNMYVYMYVCMYMCVSVYLDQGPLEGPHLLGCLTEDQIVSDGDLEILRSRSNSTTNKNYFSTQAGRKTFRQEAYLCCTP